jgi:predicted HAD superfamily Cof-like phosphohydrolase
MNKQQNQVAQFMKAFGQTVPGAFSPEQFPAELRISLINEEAREFSEAVKNQDWVETIDAICDLLYVTYGAAVALGIDIEPFFDEVHRSNMSKLDVNGRPIHRADGKVIKSDRWSPPAIDRVLEIVPIVPQYRFEKATEASS